MTNHYSVGYRPLTILALALAPFPGRLRAQAVEAAIGRFSDSTTWTAYRLGLTRPLAGIFRYRIHGDLMRQVDGVGSAAGVGADVTAFRTGDEGPYLVGGLSGGLGSEGSNQLNDLWGSWSAGVGYDLFPASFLSVGAEGRWRELSLGRRKGLEISLGVGLHLGRGSLPPSVPRPFANTPRLPQESAQGPVARGDVDRTTVPQSLKDSIIATAVDAMGRPYSYGGTGADGEGFDCSGLIQYAFGKHDVALPRRSTDQARVGTKIKREVKLLAPADILTFSNAGGRVTHVGLYIGEGRFIHSATRGVQVSVLSAADPYGRWWYKRWVGVRRIVR